MAAQALPEEAGTGLRHSVSRDQVPGAMFYALIAAYCPRKSPTPFLPKPHPFP